MNEDKMKGAFNTYVDSLVVKNFFIEQIYTRLKINKTMALNFVNKLDGNQILILSKVIHTNLSKTFKTNMSALTTTF